MSSPPLPSPSPAPATAASTSSASSFSPPSSYSDDSPISPTLLAPRHLLYDTIYTAARTPLMRAADTAGARSANGLAMLLHQGALAFEIWFQRPAPLAAMRAALHATANS